MYLGVVLFLFVLAVFDLWDGVSNDAVNFLNSAIGSKAARFRTVVAIAAVGVFCGAAMSDGMMDIARHGIFCPGQFCFKEVMYIFLAVMVTDIVLLDVFNTQSMPTSTTVSMVFELLGATFAFTMLKAASAAASLPLGEYMNTDKALQMILAIFLSVTIAFVAGTVVQYVARIVFTFNYRSKLRWKAGIFGGLALTSIAYFMLFKGLSHISLMTPEARGFIDGNAWAVLGGCFVFFAVLTQVLHAFGANVFRIVVLAGTFALATAFAGNDLVNFIGVPLAGLSSFQYFSASGAADPAGFTMEQLNGPATTPTAYLFCTGAVMIFSLATSKKARKVVQTSISLSSKDEDDEMFGSSRVARSIVRLTTAFHLAHNSLRQMLYGLLRMNEPVREHVDNHFTAVQPAQAERFGKLRSRLLAGLEQAAGSLRALDAEAGEQIGKDGLALHEAARNFRNDILAELRQPGVNITSATLLLHVVQETEQFILELRNLLKSCRKFQELS